MAKQYGGVFANWYGRVGNVVGRIRQGRTIMSIYQPNVSNPKTPAQLAQREKFSLLAAFFKTLSGFLTYSFHDLDGYKVGNPYSAAIGYNMKRDECFSGSYPNTELDYVDVQVSNGTIDLPYTPSASAEGTTVSLTWADNSGLGNAKSDDKLMVVAFNSIKNQSFYNIELADRNERNTTFNLPSSWTGDTVNIWIAMRREPYSCSASQHIAQLAL